MALKKPVNRKAKKAVFAVGDHVLLGGTRASYPGEWCYGTITFIGAAEILIERSTMNGETWHQLVCPSEIRAVGTTEQLVEIKRQCAEAVRALQQEVSDAEQALGRARDSLFAKLEDFIIKDGCKVLPPNFEQIDSEREAVRKTVEAWDSEQASAVAQCEAER